MSGLTGLVILVAVAAIGYQAARNQMAADVYHERLVELNDDYHTLAEQYNKAITRTAVTELWVQDGTVCVNVRTADGKVETHPVKADPSAAIYVDYVVKNGRLLIRRVFDEKSVPNEAGLIDSKLLDIDWSDPAVKHGQAIYKHLTDGRWIVTVSGDGALGLERIEGEAVVNLLPAPEVGDYDPIQATRAQLQKITPRDVLGRFLGAPPQTDQ